MKNKVLHFSVISALFLVILSSCSGKISVTSTSIPTSSITPTLPPKITPTATPTTPPTETPITQPTSLTGFIFLSSKNSTPLASVVELRQNDGFALFGNSETDSNGTYKIENIDPGAYDLWVLITTKFEMISGCTDVALPNDSWMMGIKLGEDNAMLIGNANLSKALLLMQNAPPSPASGLKAEGFYAILQGVKIESGIENKMDVTFICE